MPIWATDRMSEVTGDLVGKFQTNPFFFFHLFAGITANNCPKPCIQTTTYTKFVRDAPGNYSGLLILFSEDITITKTEMLGFDFLSSLSYLGSNLGLWLGLGALQLMEMIRVAVIATIYKK